MESIKIKSCTCTQCKAAKAKRGNRKSRKYFKRLLNKKRRKAEEGSIFNFYWA